MVLFLFLPPLVTGDVKKERKKIPLKRTRGNEGCSLKHGLRRNTVFELCVLRLLPGPVHSTSFFAILSIQKVTCVVNRDSDIGL